jgi:hypothetical protein
MGHTWKTTDEAFHGSKWGYAVVALVIVIVLSLLGAIFYLLGEGIRGLDIDPASIIFSSGTAVGIIIIILIVVVKIGIIAAATVTGFLEFIHAILSRIWTLFSNIYLLILTIVLTLILLSSLFVVVYNEFPISLSNPLVIGILLLLLIIFFPFAIFLIDLFSYEHE